jgi:hypothetical protein
MDDFDPDVLSDEARTVLDQLNVRPIAEYLARERLRIIDSHTGVTFEFTGPNLSKTILSHVSIGNTELEALAQVLGGRRGE